MASGLHSNHGQPEKGPSEWLVGGSEHGGSKAARVLGFDTSFLTFSPSGLGQVIPSSLTTQLLLCKIGTAHGLL